MTDALAQWFLSRCENGERPWEAVAALSAAAQPEDAFTAWIEELRTQDGLRNDDVVDARRFMLTRPPNVAIRDLVILEA